MEVDTYRRSVSAYRKDSDGESRVSETLDPDCQLPLSTGLVTKTCSSNEPQEDSISDERVNSRGL